MISKSDDMNSNFPRDLTKIEEMVLYSILPENKNGYNDYRNKISNLKVLGNGRFGGNNFILGKEGIEIDLSISSAPVFAIGTVSFAECDSETVIHEEQDEMIEYDINLIQNITNANLTLDQFVKDEIINVDSLSFWNPGDKALYDHSFVNEFELFPGKYVLAVAASLKKIWLHSFQTGVNHIIPLTNFYNELMRHKNIKDHTVALNPNKFFEQVEEYSVDDIRKTLINYSWYLKKFDMNEAAFDVSSSKEPSKSFINILRKKQN